MGDASHEAFVTARPAGVEVMEKQDRREQARDGAIGSSLARHALIFNSGSSHCATNRCESLRNLLSDTRFFNHIYGSSGSVLPAEIAFVPDVVVLRFSLDCDNQKLVATCRNAWARAAILAVVCPGFNRLTGPFSAALNSVDDFLSCPFPDHELLYRLRRLLQNKTAIRESSTSEGIKIGARVVPIIGASRRFRRAVEKIPLLAECRDTVLISGETGSGKEVFSRAIHYQSPRHGKPFVPVNCGALPDHLFENELFGHVKGAFTDASSAEKGLIAEAEGGTLFLDEIDTLSQAGQVKLLRFLQDGEYRPVGAARSINADVRIIAATNADLRERVASQRFREDLFYRLNALSLSLPALRERIEDIVPLTVHVLNQYAGEHGQEVRAISAGALDKLMGYSWPGNIRELESVIIRALTFSCVPILQAEDIELPMPPWDAITQSRSLRDAKNSTIASFERRYLAGLLAQHQGNVTHAAKAAGKERRSFQRLLRKHNLDRHSFQE
jgi:two-component system, NtrC family, response regulator GlrR